MLIAGPAAAAMLSVSPVTLEIAAPRTNAKLNLENRGEEPVTVQIRVFRWASKNGKESLTPTTSVVASPPIATLKPQGKYTVRIVRVAKEPVTSEESYRLLVDQLPKLVNQPGSAVSFLIRQSIPVFFYNRRIAKTVSRLVSAYRGVETRARRREQRTAAGEAVEDQVQESGRRFQWTRRRAGRLCACRVDRSMGAAEPTRFGTWCQDHNSSAKRTWPCRGDRSCRGR